MGKALGSQGQAASPECNEHRMTDLVLVQGKEKRSVTLSISYGSFTDILPAGSLDLEPFWEIGKEGGEESIAHLPKI